MKKWLLLALYILMLIMVFIYRNAIVDFMNQHHSFPLLVGVAALIALFPVVPYKLVIAALGYAYGTIWAAAITWLGTMLAATIIYGLVRYLFSERGRRYLEQVQSLQKFTLWIEKHPFISIAAARMIPIIPQMAVNVFAGAASLPFWSYTAASGIGKLPGIILYAFLGGNLTKRPLVSAAVIAGYVILVGVIVLIYRKSARYGQK